MLESEVRALVTRYPFLLPRNVFTDKIPDDYDYTYITYLGIPRGWKKLFFQMCEDIRQPLIDADYLDKFRFTQIKEKYNTMRCYHFGAPEKADEIISKYGQMASYICTQCGRPAVYETSDYIASFCESCWKDVARHSDCELIDFKPFYKISGYKNGEHYEKTISFEDEWRRYITSLDKELTNE